MEQARYWMWTNRKHDFGSQLFVAEAQNNNPPSYGGDSWEEQAFAEDAAGALGGCVWPPRSYTCSFCRREFKSAQALGGHMNVHRRDRARLKQHGGAAGAGAGDVLPHSHNNNINLNPLDVPQQYSPTLLYNHSSINSDHHQDRRVRVSISSSPPPPQPPPLIFSSILSENCLKRKSCDMSSPDQSGLNLVADKFFSVSDWTKGDNKSSFKTSKSNHHDGRANKAKEDEEYVKADLNLLLCRNHSNDHHHHVSSEEDDDHQFPSCNKRRRTDRRHHEEITSSNSHFLSSKQSFQVLERYCKIPLTSSNVPKLMSPNPIGDLDLELRLGDPPKLHVK